MAEPQAKSTPKCKKNKNSCKTLIAKDLRETAQGFLP
jgi:hypothetical protein